ncbi:flagellar biosynthetic protein FliR [Thalassotalea euphylliae]|uniref:Flagellar biosynthetic protein FliR n=1 Tax=Thalassotalea euphylliae TaxID=1655234 RepID=A0A3E0TZY5_9GAMM|nr:flagellar biosynthetic protein FliR [Thalassotalea euphylliae]REL30251.1 flagellar type III secretion system protein FliR [Thalassotalea euphylliae]
MEFTESVINQFMADLLLPLTRVSALVMSMIGLGAQTIPTRIKLLLCIAITLAIMPAIPPVGVDNLFAFETFLLVVEQILIGVLIGFVTVLVVNTFTLAGQIIAMQTGLGFASLVDPASGTNVPAVGQFFLILSTLLFWGLDGHLTFLQFIVISFETIPIPSEGLETVKYKETVEWAGWMFTTALSLALAPLTAMLLINFSFGIMTRAAPQLNIFSVGFPITMTGGLIIMWLTLGNFLLHFEQQWARAIDFTCYLVDCGAR